MTMTFGLSADNVLCLHKSSLEELIGAKLDDCEEWLPEALAVRMSEHSGVGQSWYFRLIIKSYFARPTGLKKAERAEVLSLLPKREQRIYAAWNDQAETVHDFPEDTAVGLLAGIANVVASTVEKDLLLFSCLGLLHSLPPPTDDKERS